MDVSQSEVRRNAFQQASDDFQRVSHVEAFLAAVNQESEARTHVVPEAVPVSVVPVGHSALDVGEDIDTVNHEVDFYLEEEGHGVFDLLEKAFQ